MICQIGRLLRGLSLLADKPAHTRHFVIPNISYQCHFQNAIVAVENPPPTIFPSPRSRKIVYGSFVGRFGCAGFAVPRQPRQRSVSEIRKSLPPAALWMNLDGSTDSVTLDVTLELSYCCLRFTLGLKANARLTYGPSDGVKRTY